MSQPFRLESEGIPTAKVELAEVVNKRLDKVEERFARFETNIDDRLTTMETNIGGALEQMQSVAKVTGEVLERVGKTSERVRGESKMNLEQSKDIAAVITKVDGIEASIQANTAATLAIKTALVDGVGGFFKRHKALEKGLFVLVMAAIAAATSYFQSHR